MKKAFTIIVCLILSISLFGQGRIVFHKKHSTRKFSMPYYGQSVVKMKNGKRYVGIITANSNSTIFFRSQPKKRTKEHQKEINRAAADHSLTRKEHHIKLLRALYNDSLALSYDSIKSIRFALAWDPRRVPRSVGGSFLFATCWYFGFTSFVHDTVSNPFHLQPSVGAALLVGGLFILFESTNKIIRTDKWEMKKEE